MKFTLACGHCYGAATSARPCCNSCQDVIQAYVDLFWHYDINDFKQCREDGQGTTSMAPTSTISDEIWKVHLKDSLRTCLIDIQQLNVLMVAKSESFEDCKFKANKALSSFKDANYFFWSPFKNPSGKVGVGNCLVFRSCDSVYYSKLIKQGSTYRRANLR